MSWSAPLVDLYASRPHYLDHLEPVWEALPDHLQGRRWSPRDWRSRDCTLDTVVLVGSLVDHMAVAPRRTVLVEHGAGQTYRGDPRSAGHGSYAGGDGLERVVLFVCPSQRVADAWGSRYSARTVVAGSPRLDRLDQLIATSGVGIRQRMSPRPAVAITFHWNCTLVPETRSAFAHYHRGLPRFVAELRAEGVDVIGHAHPRMADDLEAVWRRLRVRQVRDFATVVAEADVLVVDNSSVLYEWAALDRPAVVMNAPWYRRSVDHGLRFWDLVPGWQVDGPDELLGAVLGALADPALGHGLRREAAAAVYAHRDGQAAARAADAIVEALL